MSTPSTLITFLSVLLLACFTAAQNSASYPTAMAKRGGARAFHGLYSGHGSKRFSEIFPYYLYEKRGGGRAFFGGWQPYESIGRRFYDNPAYYKRSSNLWEFLEDRNSF